MHDHNEEDPIANDPINASPIETEIYKPRQRSTQRFNVRIDWTVPGVGDFSIQSIPEIILSTDEYELYEGAIFKNKDELKTSLGKYALKQKFEYRITKSSKTRFLVSCKYKSCTFKLRASSVQESSYWTVAKFVRDHSCQLELFSNCSRQVPAKVVSTVVADKLLGKVRVI